MYVTTMRLHPLFSFTFSHIDRTVATHTFNGLSLAGGLFWGVSGSCWWRMVSWW